MKFDDENLDFVFGFLNSKIKNLNKNFITSFDICKNKKEEKEALIKYIVDCIKSCQNVLEYIKDMEVEE